MARPSKVPDGAEVVRTYDKLNWFLTAFAEGYFWLLIVVGPSGTSKSASIKAAMKGKRILQRQRLRPSDPGLHQILQLPRSSLCHR